MNFVLLPDAFVVPKSEADANQWLDTVKRLLPLAWPVTAVMAADRHASDEDYCDHLVKAIVNAVERTRGM